MEWAFAVSLIINLWFGYTIGDIKAERDQLASIAKNFKLEEQDERKREFESATERELARSDIERVITRSKLNPRADHKGVSVACRGELDRRSLSIMDEAKRRSIQINKSRMRTTR